MGLDPETLVEGEDLTAEDYSPCLLPENLDDVVDEKEQRTLANDRYDVDRNAKQFPAVATGAGGGKQVAPATDSKQAATGVKGKGKGKWKGKGVRKKQPEKKE